MSSKAFSQHIWIGIAIQDEQRALCGRRWNVEHFVAGFDELSEGRKWENHGLAGKVKKCWQQNLALA